MSGVLINVFLFVLILGHELQHVACGTDEYPDTYAGSHQDSDNWSSETREKTRPSEPTFDDNPDDEFIDKGSNKNSNSFWYRPESSSSTEKSSEESETSTAAPQKNIFIYVPFRASDTRTRFRQQSLSASTTTATTTTTTPKPDRPAIAHPTLRTTFSSAWPPADSPSLRSISRSSPEYRGLEKWKPVSGLKESASSSFYTQAAVPLVQAAPVLQSPVVQSPTQIPLSSPTLLFAPPQPVPLPVQQAPPVHDVHVVQAPQQQQPVQLSVLQAPAAPPPIQLNLVRSPPQPQAVHVNFVRAQPQTLVQAAPLVHQHLVQAPPVHTHLLQPAFVHAHPVAHAPVVRAPVLHDPPPVFVQAAPPCPTPVFAPTHLHAPPRTFFSAPIPQRTRTVLQQVQYVPDHTHVFTTTSFSPATRTTIYEADHLAAFSAPKGHYVRAPHSLRSPAAPLYSDRESPATIYTFPKMRILGAPFRVAGRLSSRRLLRQRLREERRKEKLQKEKEKKILVFNSRNSD